MDPIACLADILRNLDNARGMEPCPERDDSIGNALDGMRHLANWLERGGFPPDPRLAVERALPDFLESIRDQAKARTV